MEDMEGYVAGKVEVIVSLVAKTLSDMSPAKMNTPPRHPTDAERNAWIHSAYTTVCQGVVTELYGSETMVATAEVLAKINMAIYEIQNYDQCFAEWKQGLDAMCSGNDIVVPFRR